MQEAARRLDEYAAEIVTIYEKMPEFHHTFFCFYAYDTARLFERMLDVDPKEYLSFSLEAPDAFFYALYGGMAGLYEEAKRRLSLSWKRPNHLGRVDGRILILIRNYDAL